MGSADLKEIGKRIRAKRIANKMSQEDLETLIRVANALNVTADTILADCLTNHIVVSHMEYARIFEDCSTYESRIIIDVAKAIKQSLRDNHFILSNLEE